MQHGDPVADFMAMTGCASEDVAINYLSLADFDLTNAVVMHQAEHNEDSGSAARPAAPPAVVPPVVDVEDDEADIASYLANIRDEPTPPTATSTSNASPSRIATLSTADPVFPARPVDNPERNDNVFDGVTGAVGERLQRLFATPPYVRVNESLQMVCAAAQRKDRWVLVSIRDASFASNCVARDVWNFETMSDAAQHLECVEYHISTTIGEQCMNSFRVPRNSLPCFFLVDPFTCHREKDIALRRVGNGAIDGGVVVDELLIFIGTKGSPSQLHAAMEGSEGPTAFASKAVVVEDDEDANDSSLSGTPVPATHRGSSVALSAQPPARAVVVEVTLDDWTLPAEDKNGFKLRVRLPKASLTLCLRPDTPVSLLLQYLSYRVHIDDAQTYPSPPAVEVRGGFPPKPLPPPPTATAPLSAWGNVQSGEALMVHIT